MRHGNKVNHLGRTTGHRAALLKNMANSLIIHKRIQTTLAKAKELRKFIEPLATKSKLNTTHSRRVVFTYLQNKYAVDELFTNVAPKIQNRPGGYVRVIKTGFRKGDGAETALIEFVDFNELYNPSETKAKAAGKKTRRSGVAKKAASPAATPTAVVEESPVVEDVIEASAPVVEDMTSTESTETSDEQKDENA